MLLLKYITIRFLIILGYKKNAFRKENGEEKEEGDKNDKKRKAAAVIIFLIVVYFFHILGLRIIKKCWLCDHIWVCFICKY